jgi:hypothetical protein
MSTAPGDGSSLVAWDLGDEDVSQDTASSSTASPSTAIRRDGRSIASSEMMSFKKSCGVADGLMALAELVPRVAGPKGLR